MDKLQSDIDKSYADDVIQATKRRLCKQLHKDAETRLKGLKDADLIQGYTVTTNAQNITIDDKGRLNYDNVLTIKVVSMKIADKIKITFSLDSTDGTTNT